MITLGSHQFWSDLRAVLMSEELRQEIFALVSQEEEQWIRTDILLIRDHLGYHIAPHPDTHLKSVTAQIYLPKTRLRPHLGTCLYDIQVCLRIIVLAIAMLLFLFWFFYFSSSFYFFKLRPHHSTCLCDMQVTCRICYQDQA